MFAVPELLAGPDDDTGCFLFLPVWFFEALKWIRNHVKEKKLLPKLVFGRMESRKEWNGLFHSFSLIEFHNTFVCFILFPQDFHMSADLVPRLSGFQTLATRLS